MNHIQERKVLQMNITRAVCFAVFCALLITGTAGLSFSEEKRSSGNIAFNFVDVEIPTVIKFISEITGNNFIFDERVRGKITIIAPAKLSIDESFSLFTSVLSLKGYTIIPLGPKTYKIVSSSQAKEEGKLSTDETIPVNEAYITKLLPTQHIKADDTIPFLRPVVSRDGYLSAFGPGNLLLVVDSAVNIEKITSILNLIDKPSAQEEQAKINVYFLENADATNLAKVLEGTLKNMQTSYRTSRDKQKAPGDIPPFSITPDKSTNSLIVIAPPSDYENIAEVIRTLDRRRKQVYVEAMIIEASIDKLKELGTKWRTIASHNGEPVAVGGFGNVSTTTLLSIINGLTGFTAGGMGNFLDIPLTSISSTGTISTSTLTAPGFAALFSLNDFKDAVNVLSTPQILTSDNEEAEIVVGENVPFISKRERDVTTTNTVLSSIERKDVGITLRLTPQITEGDYVKLDIFQEISALKETSESILTSVGPTTTKRSTKTSVVVKDGRTVVISGLMQERDEENIAKMPVLGDIPVMGWFFKTKNVSKNKTNLLVFLSPHIVKESDQLSKITEEKHKEFSTREKLYSPGELMIKFKEDIPGQKAAEIIMQHGATVIKYFEDIHVYHIKLRPGHNVDDAIEEFSALPEILYAEPNYKVKINRDTSSPRTNHNSTQVNDPFPGNDQNIKMKGSPFPAPEQKTGTSSPPPAMSDVVADPSSDKSHEAHPLLSTDTGEKTTAVFEESSPLDKKKLLSAEQLTPEAKKTGNYYIQVGAWLYPQNAQKTMNLLANEYPDIYLIEENNIIKVRIPGIMTKNAGESVMKKLRKDFKLKPILMPNKI
ncbi:MAG: hypothetical protein C4538_00295 [Nitrospiraceae bacterium]|nr:MAG: hypothetical protein C4538_00295 [Nitrospiraceae bacterium]